MYKKEGLKEIISRPPFTPVFPIGRKNFFLGLLLIAVIAFALNFGLSVLFGGINFFISTAIGVVFSYVMAMWYTKRFLDIKATTNTKVFLIVFFILILLLNILTYIQTGMMAELRAFSDYIVMNGLDALGGAPDVSATTEMYAVPVSIARAIIGIPLLLFVLFLLFKKGSKVENSVIENK